MLQSLVNWAMALTDAQRYGIIAIFWACVMVGLLVMVWNDPEMWTKPEGTGGGDVVLHEARIGLFLSPPLDLLFLVFIYICLFMYTY